MGRLDLASSSKGADVSLVLRGDRDVVHGRPRCFHPQHFYRVGRLDLASSSKGADVSLVLTCISCSSRW